MSKKLWLVALTAIFLGGCNLSNLGQKEAASDTRKVAEPIAETSLSQTEDPKLQAVPSVDSDNSLEGIEEDMANTEFYDEDYSDLEQ